jgi:hypothetical protein
MKFCPKRLRGESPRAASAARNFAAGESDFVRAAESNRPIPKTLMRDVNERRGQCYARLCGTGRLCSFCPCSRQDTLSLYEGYSMRE